MNAVKPKHSAYSLSEPELLELLRKMDAAESNGMSRDRRKHARHSYLCRETPIKVIQPGGGTTERFTTVRDLSVGGASILYPGYLHKGSIVHLELRKRAGGKELVQGMVENCRHVHATWHAVGVKFKEAIFPQLFLTQSAKSGFEEPEARRVDLSRLKGAILLVDDQMMDRGLFIHLLKGSSLSITEAASAEEAITLVARSLAAEREKSAQAIGPFDLIVCDLNLGAVTGESAISKMREAGYRGPVLVMTAETSPDRLAAAQAAGSASILHKPYSPEKLHAAIAGQLAEGAIAIDDPIYSPLCSDPQNRITVEKYVSQVRATAAELRKWVGQENLQQVRTICQTLKGTGVGYGFAVLTNFAAAALTSLDASFSVEESVIDLHRLDAICSRLTAAAPPPENGSRR